MDTIQLLKLISGYIKDIKSGKKIDELDTKGEISKDMIRAYLLQYGGAEGRKILVDEILVQLPISIEEIKEKFGKGMHFDEIASEIDMDSDEFINLIKKYESYSGDVIKKQRGKDTSRHDVDWNIIIKRYTNGERLSHLAKEYGTAYISMQNQINKYIINTGKNIEEIHKENRAKRKNNYKDDIRDNEIGGFEK